MELTSIPGVGAKTADALEQLDDPERALSEGDDVTVRIGGRVIPVADGELV